MRENEPTCSVINIRDWKQNKLRRSSQRERLELAFDALRRKGYFTSMAEMCHCKMPIGRWADWNTSGQWLGKVAPLVQQGLGICPQCFRPRMPEGCFERAVLAEDTPEFDGRGNLTEHLPLAWNGEVAEIVETVVAHGLTIERDRTWDGDILLVAPESPQARTRREFLNEVRNLGNDADPH